MPQTIINYLIIKQKKLLISGGILLFLGVGVWIYSSFTYVYLTVANLPSGIARDSLSITISDGYDDTKIQGEGLKILPKETKSLNVTAGKTMSQHIPVNPPWYRFMSVASTLNYSKDAQATSFSSMTGSTCATYDNYHEQLVGYNCNAPASLLRTVQNNQGYWTTEATKTFGYINNLASPYKHGLIGALYTDDYGPAVGVVDSKGERQVYHLPKEITFNDLRASKLAVASSDSANTRFAIITVHGDVYAATPAQPGQLVEYKKYSAPKNYDQKKQQTLCTIQKDNAYCYRGAHIRGDQQLSDKERTPATISVLSFKNQSQSTRSVTNNMIEDIYVTKKGAIYVREYTTLYKANEQGSSYQFQQVAQYVGSVAAGENIYYTSRSGVFELDESTAYANQLFYSPHISPKRIYPTNEKLFVLGAIKDGPQQIYAYEILPDDYHETRKRLVDLFPAKPGAIPEILSQKLVKDTLHISVAAPITKTAVPTAESIAQLNSAKERVTKAIQEKTGEIDVSIEFLR